MFKRIYIEITNICNLNCSFCPKTKRTKQFMSLSNFENILKRIKGYTDYIYLHVMGEPLMHPHLKEILDKAYQYQLKVNITTNGHLLKDKLDIINSSPSIRQLNISLHSFNPDDFDSIKDIISTIKLINKNYYISLRLWNFGNKDNKKIIDYLGTTFNINNLYKISLSDKRIKLDNNVFLDQDIEFIWPNIHEQNINEKGKCYGLRTQISILVDGTVIPCCLDSEGIINLGNIFNEELDTILDKQKCKEIREGFKQNKLVESLCKRCNFITRFNK